MLKRLQLILIFGLLCFNFSAAGQQIKAVRIEGNPKIDGKADDAEWQEVPVAFSGAFTQIVPENLEPSRYMTEIKLAYNNVSFYVLARLYDRNGTNIPSELGLRDEWHKNADLFAFVLDTYNKGQNAFYFGVTSAGVQLDQFISPNGGDSNWNAVWNSSVEISKIGWTVELEIPFSAIRFPKTPVQEWRVNFVRKVQREQEESAWNPVDNSISGFVNQMGKLEGVRNVVPPLRLQFFPYLSSSLNHNGEIGSYSSSIGGGMDVKYGINESFTLDMSLVPDFSQVQSDNQVLNLSPFEVKFSENRPFFTEGTELFNKGGLFYSRRVGQVFNTFKAGGKLAESEHVVSRPADAQLLNAVKVTGRTKRGFGLGFFNAITDNTYLEVVDSLTLEKRRLLIDPLTNFNMIVLDQNLKNNSGISLINSNVSRSQGGRDANVIATDFRFHDKTNTYRLEGFGAYNYIRPTEGTGAVSATDGYKYTLSAGKVSGNVRWRLGRSVESDDYDINDLGFLRAANEIHHSLQLGYHIFKPFWVINRMNVRGNAGHSTLYEPREFINFQFGGDYWIQFKNFWHMGGWYGTKPVNSFDFFEPRESGYFFIRRPSYDTGIWLESDSRKRLSIYGQYGMFRRPAWDAMDYWFTVAPRFRLNDRFSLSHHLSASRRMNERGFVKKGAGEADKIIFGNRDVKVLENTSRLNFIFNNKMGLSLRARHYWSKVAYNRFFALGKDGHLKDVNYNGLDGNRENAHLTNFNAVNIDLLYNWQIAPGSFVTFAWKDAVFNSDKDVNRNYADNMRALSQAPQQNSFSLKITYFLDYAHIRQMIQQKEELPPVLAYRGI